MGLIRIFLALSVMFSHIGPVSWFPIAPAGFAVQCFYLMSGFYIALGLNERYTTPSMNAEFYFGRVLRLWPVYLLSLAILIPTGVLEGVAHTISQQPLFIQVVAAFSNIFMLGSDILLHVSNVDGKVVFSEFGADPAHNGVQNIINLPAWTLSIEIMFYIAAPFILRSKECTLIFFTSAIIYALAAKLFIQLTGSRLRTDLYILGPSLYFALGAGAYWLHKLHALDIKCMVRSYLMILLLVIGCTLHNIQQSILLVVLSAICPVIFTMTKNSKFDKFMGDLSYPLYIMHIPITIVVRWLGWFEANSLNYFLSIMLGSVVAVYAVELPIEKFRKHISKIKRATTQACA